MEGLKRVLALLAAVLLLAGCALEIRTTGYADLAGGGPAVPAGASFAVLENDGAANPLLDREIRGKIERLLVARGYRLAAPRQAACHLSYGYHIQPGLRTGTVTAFGPPQTRIVRVPDGRGGVTTTAVAVPGEATTLPVVTAEYDRQLTLKVTDAAQARAGGRERVLWIGESASLDPSSDLRTAIDYLLVAAFQHFGRDTGRQVTVPVGPDHPDLPLLRSAPPRR